MISRHTATWATVIVCIAYNTQSLRAAEKPATRPTTPPPATSLDPDFEQGRARARRDLQAGIITEMLPVPEVFLLEWQDAQSEDHNLLDYYKAVLADKYHVKSDWIMFNSASPGQRMWALGYNQEMRPEIEKRCGVATLNQAWKDACNLPTADRAKYLKDHAAKTAKPTTQPAPSSANPKS
jgi:hypothetical protein